MLDGMSPVDALEGGMASFETKRGCSRLVNESIFVDRKLTGAAQDFRSAKLLFVPSPKRDIVPSIACTRPPAGGSHGNPHPTARIHNESWRRGRSPRAVEPR